MFQNTSDLKTQSLLTQAPMAGRGMNARLEGWLSKAQENTKKRKLASFSPKRASSSRWEKTPTHRFITGYSEARQFWSRWSTTTMKQCARRQKYIEQVRSRDRARFLQNQAARKRKNGKKRALKQSSCYSAKIAKLQMFLTAKWCKHQIRRNAIENGAESREDLSEIFRTTRKEKESTRKLISERVQQIVTDIIFFHPFWEKNQVVVYLIFL